MIASKDKTKRQIPLVFLGWLVNVKGFYFYLTSPSFILESRRPLCFLRCVSLGVPSWSLLRPPLGPAASECAAVRAQGEGSPPDNQDKGFFIFSSFPIPQAS